MAVPTAVTAVVTTASSAVVNLATSDNAAWWLWLIAAGLTAISFGAALWLHLRQPATAPSGTPSEPVGGNQASLTVTGDGNTTVQAGRDATVSQDRSIAIDTGGGDFHGTAATGDHTRVVNAPGVVIGAIGDHNNQTNHLHHPR
ncbi:hypothetical protein [Nocardia aurantia]|uniref:hypothetical protein n=1 Tax=Nocardia aurantia TaxID=2585199 RepID=UPI0012979819|nr:hypothetical protein [Nocardia aurantia]